METQHIFFFAGVDCAPELEEKFNRWFDQVHVPLLLKFPKLKSVSRYKLTKPRKIPSRVKLVDEKWPKHLTVYEFGDLQAVEEYWTSPELEAAQQERLQTWKEGEIEVKWRAHYQFIKTITRTSRR